jgi:hypothetical protein
MKKFILSFLLLGVGILAIASKSEARIPTDDYAGISYVTTFSSSVGNNVKNIVIVDSNPANGSAIWPSTAAIKLSDYPVANNQRVTPSMIFNSSTGTYSGTPKYIDLRGIIIRSGLMLFKDSAGNGSEETYTIKFREIR